MIEHALCCFELDLAVPGGERDRVQEFGWEPTVRTGNDLELGHEDLFFRSGESQ
jgi:hypothetical protein